MLIFYILFSLIVQFVQCKLLSANSKYLQPIYFRSSYNLNIYSDNKLQTKLIQIFSPITLVDIMSTEESFKSVSQAGFMVKIYNSFSVTITSNSTNMVKVWYRVVSVPDSTASSFPFSGNLNLNISLLDSNTFLIKPNKLLANFTYELWVVPVFPNGLFQSWSSDYPVNQDTIMEILSESIDLTTGQRIDTIDSKNLYSVLVNRKVYTFILIIRICDKYSNSTLQLNPTIINGCSLYMNEYNNCDQSLISVWFIVACVVLSIFIVLVLMGFYFDTLQIFLHTWVVVGYFSSIGYHYLIMKINYTNNFGLYISIFGIGMGFAILNTFMSEKCCKKGNRCRTMFSCLCISLVFISIVYFILGFFQNISSMWIILVVVFVLLFLILFLFYGFTSTTGRLFTDIFLICVGFSLTALNSSSFSFLFLDFFHFLVFQQVNIRYISYFLWNDLIIMSLWIVLTLLLGIRSHRSWRRKNIKVESIDQISELHSDFRQPVNYGAIYSEIVTTSFVHNVAPDYSRNLRIQPSAPAATNDSPPPYCP